MNKKADYFSLIKTRLFLLLIIFSFAGPLVLASLMYKYSDIVPIPSPKSHGNLIEPVITINSNEDFYETLMNEKKWVFMYVYEDETCDLVCEATLYMMQQVRESVGRERQRISNVAIVKKSFLNNENKKVINIFGVWGPKKFMGKEYDGILRKTFIIDEKGFVERIIEKVKTKEHASQILN